MSFIGLMVTIIFTQSKVPMLVNDQKIRFKGSLCISIKMPILLQTSLLFIKTRSYTEWLLNCFYQSYNVSITTR